MTAAPGHSEQWYEVVEDSSLRQGDIIRNLYAFGFPQNLPVRREHPALRERIPTRGDVGDWIIMSASCDLERGHTVYPYVLVGRVLPATADKLGNIAGDRLSETLEVMRRGYDLRRFLLAPYPGIEPAFPLSFVQFRPHLTLPLDYIKRSCVGRRLRLRPPFREWFGNWVGSSFSRIGIEDTAQVARFVGEPPAPAAALALADLEEVSVVATRRRVRHLPRWLRKLLARIQRL